MGLFSKSKTVKSRPPKPNTKEDFIVLGEVSDTELQAVRLTIGEHEGGMIHYWKYANPRIGRLSVAQVQQFYQSYCRHCDESVPIDPSFFMLALYRTETFVTVYAEQCFGFTPTNYYLVLSPEALASIPVDGERRVLTFLQALRHFSGIRGGYRGALVVSDDHVEFTNEREDYAIRRLSTSG